VYSSTKPTIHSSIGTRSLEIAIAASFLLTT
jgi:hypothetical protein